MFNIDGPIGTLLNFLVIAFGFGAIVFVHELGHFVAAKWAKIRVLAFSMGFGRVLLSYRKGMGLRAGSSEPEYNQRLKDNAAEGISPTEYRLSALPLGGYVKMLGQEDLNPNAISAAPDSYQNASIPKRMVVISAGVVVNIVTAALLFIVVFMVGLPSMPPQIGTVNPGSPASIATPIDADLPPGLKTGDTIVSINGTRIRSFRDIATEAAMSDKNKPTKIVVRRDMIDTPITFAVDLEPSASTGLLDLGVTPARSGTFLSTDQLELWESRVQDVGLPGVAPGSTFINRVTNEPDDPLLMFTWMQLGDPIPFLVRAPDGTISEHTVTPEPRLQSETRKVDGTSRTAEHALGLTGLMRVHPDPTLIEPKQGLEPGDVFVKVASADHPNFFDAINIVSEHKGKPLDLVLLRGSDTIELTVDVDNDGRIGFLPDTTTRSSNTIAAPITDNAPEWAQPGTQILSVAGTETPTLADIPTAILSAPDNNQSQQSFSVTYRTPDGQTQATTWSPSEQQLADLLVPAYRWPGGTDLLTLLLPKQTIDRADNPVAAIDRGLHESRRVMLQTYLTFLRLFQGSVKVEHLKGPVGIAHIGTQVAEEGLIKVLFFMGLISINLAVINFLPIPIVDGGQFIMLTYEGLRGRPVPIVVQNVLTLMGLALIVSVFLLVTFNDVRSLFGL